jgi:hypothetical protein
MRFDPRPVAEEFWRLAGEEEQFPRSLQGAVSLALPLTTVYLPALSPASVAEWLAERDIHWTVNGTARSLRGCLVAHRGHGFLFMDGTMPGDEGRLTLAHEVAHFLHHYLTPRRRAIERLGAGMQAVVDGDRPATAAERLSGVLRGAPFGKYARLFDRTPDGALSLQTEAAESEADLIAFELLAPSTRLLRTTKVGLPRRQALVTDYGLPEWAAAAWAGWLDNLSRPDSFIKGLRAAASAD